MFLHLLPETQGNFQYAMEVGYIHETSYPVGEVAVLSGFFLVYFIEEVIHAWVDHHTAVKEVEVGDARVGQRCCVGVIKSSLFCWSESLAVNISKTFDVVSGWEGGCGRCGQVIMSFCFDR